MPHGEECWASMVSTASVTQQLRRPDQYYFLPSNTAERDLDAPLVDALAPAGLCPHLQARPAGRAVNKGDPSCRWVDGSSPRPL
ncbi:unnamed protein product [Schistocephalus solidus]|uniref:DNA helicase n=1 Tax=Schistocephalus solidus TaxID=70667 RepID=A0A183SYU8_SCHSO|nr:unnamed protein product [Schistocephalus solidus]